MNTAAPRTTRASGILRKKEATLLIGRGEDSRFLNEPQPARAVHAFGELLLFFQNPVDALHCRDGRFVFPRLDAADRLDANAGLFR